MSNELGGIANAAIRGTVGTCSLSDGGMVIDESNAENVKIASAITHIINGVYQTPYAVAAEIDLSALTVLSAKDGSTLNAAVPIPALAAGDDPVTKVWILACKGDEAFIVEPELETAAVDKTNHPLTCPDGYAPFAAIKVECVPTPSVGVATFVLGTTDLSGVTNQTVDFFDLAMVPPTVADLVEN